MLAKDVNDNACLQGKRSVLKFFASKLAPTVSQWFTCSSACLVQSVSNDIGGTTAPTALHG
ncbi:hypothetical protein GCM10009091_48480 [Pseudomonas brenneri]|uniref:Uncharacterized protein n=1 Tax=Pseudomonas brenneri TaxID=129817 RepID=A0A5B2UIK0_9PSED|nr:hypothetical protein [Pseudomonas brenneri]KAA2226696.1 hypothetical protein F1720_24775 [Pseudomonas brenneri]TWR74902.1 hypothetical protein FJD34_25495 [Pseudomonas brenneri]GGL61041.1 hypothetical protein GCM10009091_48480 [Pseudomonas brenneri]